MGSTVLKPSFRTWTKDSYMISTDSSLIPVATLNEAFASNEIYWAKTLPEEILREMLRNSLCFGLYEVKSSHTTPSDTSNEDNSNLVKDVLDFIGFARCVTDYTTFVYLTDVYIKPSYQAKGLGKWLISCVQEVIQSMSYLRRSLLITGDWNRSVPFYEKLLGMEVMEGRRALDGNGGEGLAVMSWKGKGNPGYVERTGR